MRKPFSSKISAAHEAADEIRQNVRKVGDAAHSQATLNLALTAVCVTALLVAALLVHSQRNSGVSHGS
jgi:hypothetical protein